MFRILKANFNDNDLTFNSRREFAKLLSAPKRHTATKGGTTNGRIRFKF